MKVRWWLEAVLLMASMASVMRCSAVSAPMVMSVPAASLSIEPTRPTTVSAGCVRRVRRRVIAPSATSVGEQVGPLAAEHVRAGQRAVAADDDQAVDAVQAIMLRAAFSRPSRVRNSSDRAEPMIGAAALDDAADVRPGERPDLVAALDQAAVALVDPVHLEPVARGPCVQWRAAPHSCPRHRRRWSGLRFA